MRVLTILVFLAANLAHAGEIAVLATGARLPVERHEIDGSRVRLYNNGGYTELPVSEVRAFVVDDSAPVAVVVPAAAPAAAAPEPAPSVLRVPSAGELADAAAAKYGLPRELVRSVMAYESGNQTNAVSPKGAIGLMQLMPQTAQDLGVDPYDPAQNVDGGVHYLRDLLAKYNGQLFHALAAYNAGPGAVEKYNGIPPYRETINYIYRIDTAYKAAQQNPR